MELDNNAQGHKTTNTLGTNTVFFLDHKAIRIIHAVRMITHACITVDYRQQKTDPNRVRIIVGGNLIEYT